MNLTELSREIHFGNIQKGFYDEKRNFGEMIALVHSELSEALEAHRKGNESPGIDAFDEMYNGLKEADYSTAYNMTIKGSVEEEIADAIIRLLDMSAYYNIDIQKHIDLKRHYNFLRPYKHNKQY